MTGKINTFIFLLSLFSGYLFGQSKTNSPYSRLGIGDLITQGSIRNIGMGGTGISNPHPEFINVLNPALLPVNRYRNLDSTLKNTMFDAGLTAHFLDVKSSTAANSSSGLNMAYFVFAFPLSSRWTTSVGLRPLSSVNNTYAVDGSVVGDNNTIIKKYYNTKGGINRVFLANGYDITKNISAGLDLSYLFGNITTQGISQLQPYDFANKFGYQNVISYSGFQVKPGLAYRAQIKKATQGNNIFFNLGLTYDYFAGMQAREVRDLVTLNASDGQLASTRQQDSIIKVTLPKAMGFGLSLDKPDAWAVAADFSYSKWSSYKDFQSSSNIFKDSYTISLGGEFKMGKNELIKRKEIRAGLSYSKSPLMFNGKQLDDFSFSAGTTLQVSSKKASPNPVLPKLNLAIVIGQRGTTSNNLLLEHYIRAYLGITVNDKWFRKRKID